MKFFLLRVMLCAALLSFVAGGAQASKYGGGEAYARPTFRDLAHTMLFMEGLHSEENAVVDEYAKLSYCDMYQEKYKDDFEWNKIRNLLLQKIQTKKDYFRVLYQIEGVVYLGRYNFETQDFPFVNESGLLNVGSLVLLDMYEKRVENVRDRLLCNSRQISRIFPAYYIFHLNQPFTLDRLKLPMDEAEKLLERMRRMKNEDRRLYVRFRLRVIAAKPASQVTAGLEIARLSGELTAVDLFLDKEMTQPFASIEVK